MVVPSVSIRECESVLGMWWSEIHSTDVDFQLIYTTTTTTTTTTT